MRLVSRGRAWGGAVAVAVVLAVGAVAAGCGSGGGDGGTDTGARAPSDPVTRTIPPLPPTSAATTAAPVTPTRKAPPGTSGTRKAPSPTRTTHAPAPTRTSRPPAASDTSGCFDGTCTITVTKPTTIRVDAHRFGFSSFRITRISSSGVTVAADTGGTHLESGVSPGGTAGLNTLRVKVLSVSGGTARLQLTH